MGKMVSQLKRYETYTRWIRRASLFVGLWPDRASTRFARVLLSFHVISCLMTSFGIFYYVWLHRTNLVLATRGFGIAVGMVTMLLKVLVFIRNWDTLLELHETLGMSFQEDLENPELGPILLTPLNFFCRTSFWLSLLTWMISLFLIIIQPISAIVQLVRNISPIRYNLVFPSTFPWGPRDDFAIFFTMYVVETFGGLATSGIAVATDSLFGMYIFQMSSQFRTLSNRMSNLKGNKDFHRVVKECATRHRTLMFCRDRLERVFGPIVLWMMIFSAVMICANIFQTTKIGFPKAIPIFIHAIMKLVQTYLYGLYGSLLLSESDSFRDAVYFSGWPNVAERSSASNICIMLMYKPLGLKAFHFSTISMDMFIAVSNTALSYFFLMRFIESMES